MTNQGKIYIPANSVRERICNDIVNNNNRIILDVATKLPGNFSMELPFEVDVCVRVSYK